MNAACRLYSTEIFTHLHFCENFLTHVKEAAEGKLAVDPLQSHSLLSSERMKFAQ
jgi:hypothetical protein